MVAMTGSNPEAAFCAAQSLMHSVWVFLFCEATSPAMIEDVTM